MKNLIRFKKQRELGTIITDTFTFLRDNWKPLFGLIFKIAGPALLFLVLAYVYYMQSFSAILSMMDNLDAAEVMPTSLLLYMFLLVLAGVVYYALLNGVVLHYIQSYINNNGAVKTTEVTDGIRNDFWKLIGTGIVIGILTTVGMILCVIPGIYIGVALSPLYAIVVFEKRDVIDAISHCFKLIKDEWWMTFATLLVIFILYYLIVLILQIPQFIYFSIKGVSMMELMSTDPAAFFDWTYILLTSISFILQYLLYTIIVLCVAFIYFHLHVKKYEAHEV